MEAVKQWVYKPYLLNGEPVEVDTTITVNYALDNSAQSQHDNANHETFNVGGPVHPPVLLSAPDPQYTEAARNAKLSGNVIVAMLVDQNGQTQNVHVVQGLGNGLDDKAVEAVQQYKFKPATLNGEPVPVNLRVEVNFRVY